MLSSNINNWTIRTLCYGVLLGLAWLQMSIALQEQTQYTSNSGSVAILDTLRSSYLLDWHGKRLYRIEGNVIKAQALFTKALVMNPLYIPAWLGLAEIFNDQGRKPESQAILEYVDRLSEGISRWRWDKALLAYQLGRMDILARDISFVIANIHGQSRQNALKMAFSLWSQPQELLKNVGEHNVLPLFQHATQTKKVEMALALWPYIEALGVNTNQKIILSFVEVLIQNGEVQKAISIWKKYFNPGMLLYDGSFGEDPLNMAFGWRAPKAKGSTWRREGEMEKEKMQSLRLHFSGTENMDFNGLSQLVPLHSGRNYRLTGWLKTEKLSTDQRPFIEIVGHTPCKIPPVTTTMMDESQPWGIFALDFFVAEGCDAVLVRVRRNLSTHLDNLLAGDLWLRGLKIEEASETSESHSALEILPVKKLP